MFDVDGDGTISFDDLKRFMESIGEQLTDEQLLDVINEVDSSGSASGITYSDFYELIQNNN